MENIRLYNFMYIAGWFIFNTHWFQLNRACTSAIKEKHSRCLIYPNYLAIRLNFVWNVENNGQKRILCVEIIFDLGVSLTSPIKGILVAKHYWWMRIRALWSEGAETNPGTGWGLARDRLVADGGPRAGRGRRYIKCGGEWPPSYSWFAGTVV